MVRTMYHTQEKRYARLVKPIPCKRDDAWLGEACYFWLYEEDAMFWGSESKRRTGWYEIYVSEIDCEDILDTVFNEEQYTFWLEVITDVAKKIIKKTKLKPTLKELNDYLKENGKWSSVKGILFQDLPNNEQLTLVQPITYKNIFTGKVKKSYFSYRKRVQLALFNQDVMLNFVHHFESRVV